MKNSLSAHRVLYKTAYIFLFSVFCFLFSVSISHAQEPKEPIVVNGDRVEYFHEKKMVEATKNIVITYKDVTLTCDKITVWLDTKEAIAEGNVKITQKESYFTGEKISYNFETKKGRVINGYVDSKPFYGKAQEMEKVSETLFNLKRGSATTCDLSKPHYRVQAKQVKIYLDDRVEAKHIIFFVGDFPLMYFPYYTQSLKDKTAHATVLVGNERDWGYYALVAYRYHFSDIAKGRFNVDYRSKKGLAVGVDNYYTTESLGYGSARFYIINENDITTYSRRDGPAEVKWRAQVRHRWDLGYDTVGMLEYNQYRDENFIKDYYYKEYEEEGTEPDNYISFITTKQDYTTTLLLRKRMERYYNVVERLPEFDIDIKNYRLGWTNFYYRGFAGGGYLNETFAKANPTPKDVNTVRVHTYNQLSYVAKLFKFWSATPYIGTDQTYYSRNKWGATNLIRGALTAGLDNSTKFYKIYNLTSDLFGIEINKLRHIITPIANYYYTHQPTVSPDNLNQFDEVDALEAANGIQLSLENKLQTKRRSGGDLKSVDMVNFIVSSDYMFRLRKHALAYKSQKFKSVDFQLEVLPYPWLYSLSKMSVNTKKCIVQSGSVDLYGSRGEDWALGFGYRYEDVETGQSNLATMDLTYKMTPKWKTRVYERFDLNKGSFQEQEYTIYRDLHCWLAEVTFYLKSYDVNDYGIWFALRLKAFPDMPIGFRRTYSRARPGAFHD